MNRVLFEIGPIQIYWYSIFIFLGMLIASVVVFREAKRRSIEEEFLINLICNSIIIGLIGARIYYVIFNLSYYINNPLEIFAIWNGGLAIHGGILSAFIFMIYYCKKHKYNILQILDIAVVGLIIGQSIGRWGNFFNSEAYGGITTFEVLRNQGIPKFIIDGMYILGEYRQPTFFYESFWCFITFLILLIVRTSKKLKRGQLSGIYLICYGIIRFIIESMRTDSLMLGPIKIAQLVSLVFIIGGIILFIYNIKKSTEDDKKLYREVLIPKDEDEGFIKFYKKRGDHYV